jgi:nitrite reductase/ring-hydroxylating ferredoxin subunit
MSKLVKVAEAKEVAPGTGKVVEAEGRSIALFNVAGTFHAIDNTCTHEGGPLAEHSQGFCSLSRPEVSSFSGSGAIAATSPDRTSCC